MCIRDSITMAYAISCMRIALTRTPTATACATTAVRALKRKTAIMTARAITEAVTSKNGV